MLKAWRLRKLDPDAAGPGDSPRRWGGRGLPKRPTRRNGTFMTAKKDLPSRAFVVADHVRHRVSGIGHPVSCPLRSRPRGCSSMAELQPSKLVVRVRFPSPAPSWSALRIRLLSSANPVTPASSSPVRFRTMLGQQASPRRGFRVRFPSPAPSWSNSGFRLLTGGGTLTLPPTSRTAARATTATAGSS